MENNPSDLFDLALVQAQRITANGKPEWLQYNKKSRCFELRGKTMQCKPTRKDFEQFCTLLKIEPWQK